MNRARFLALFGLLPFAAKGQYGVVAVQGTKDGPGWTLPTATKWQPAYRSIPLSDLPSSPLNGECPVCGTLAPAYSRAIRKDQKAIRPAYPDAPEGDIRRSIVIIETEDVPVGPMECMTRCVHCSAAFWQDAGK